MATIKFSKRPVILAGTPPSFELDLVEVDKIGGVRMLAQVNGEVCEILLSVNEARTFGLGAIGGAALIEAGSALRAGVALGAPKDIRRG